MKFHLDCVVHRYSKRSRAFDWYWDSVVQSYFVQVTPVLHSGQKTGKGIPWSWAVRHRARRCRLLVSIIPFIIRIPCTILVIPVLRRQGWNRACKEKDVLWCKQNNMFSSYIVYYIVYDIVRLTYDIVRQNTGSCHFDVRHRIRYRTFFDDVAYDV